MSNKKYIYNITSDPNRAASKVISLVGNDKDVLEIGCASGVQTRYLQERLGCRVTGLEVDPIAGEDARPYCEKLVIGSIEDLDLDQMLGAKRFDVVTFADVLEHLYRPENALKKVAPFLGENGYVVASVPNIAHVAVCWELAHGRFNYQEYGLLDNTHIRFFTKKNLVMLFEEAGYKVISWDRVIKSPEDTEFNIYCSTPQDSSFLDWLCDQNSEAFTYQFIIKARPIEEKDCEFSYQHLEAREKISQLESEIKELSRNNIKLESKIAWLENNRFGMFSRLISGLRKKKRPKI